MSISFLCDEGIHSFSTLFPWYKAVEITPDKFDPVSSLFFFFLILTTQPLKTRISPLLQIQPLQYCSSHPDHTTASRMSFSLPETQYCFLRRGRDLFCDTPFQVTLPSLVQTEIYAAGIP